MIHFICCYRDKVHNTGLIVCQVCSEDFQTTINCKLESYLRIDTT